MFTVAMEQIANGAPIPPLFPSMPNTFHPPPPTYIGANQLGYPFPAQAPPPHHTLQTLQQQQQPFQQFFGAPPFTGAGMDQIRPSPVATGANGPIPQSLVPPPSTVVGKTEVGPPPISGTSAAVTPPQPTPKLSKRTSAATPGSPSKEQRKRSEVETPAGKEAGPERVTA